MKNPFALLARLRPTRTALGHRVALVLSGAVLLFTLLACLGTVDGDRAISGMCPPGETCSTATPLGLQFVGHTFYDDMTTRLGPILVGGTFEVGLITAGGEPLPSFNFAVDVSGVLTATRGIGTFGPTNSTGTPIYPVDAHLVLRALAPGSTFLRIVDPVTGELFDRLRLDTHVIDDVEVSIVRGGGRTQLLAGCREMIGVHLLANDGTQRFRAFDQSVTVRADVPLESERSAWDCFFYDVPPSATLATFEIIAGFQTFVRTLPVQSLAAAGLTACPPVTVD